MEPTIVSENEWLIALDKPAGLIVHSDSRTEEPTLVEWLLRKHPQIAEVGDVWVSPQGVTVARPGIVHRLDRGTSGVMIVAKTQEAWNYLRAEFKARRIEKKYRALLHGVVEKDAGRIVAEIDKGGTPKKWYAKDTTEYDVRAAITDWKVLERREGVTYVEASPKTGRTHQLRVHFAHIGHPIVNDPLYGGHPAADRIMLHAYSISVEMPGGVRVTYTAPVPAGFE